MGSQYPGNAAACCRAARSKLAHGSASRRVSAQKMSSRGAGVGAGVGAAAAGGGGQGEQAPRGSPVSGEQACGQYCASVIVGFVVGFVVVGFAVRPVGPDPGRLLGFAFAGL